jgi:glutathione S-transferase
MSDLHLYSYQACPFARRTRMVLLEKGLDFALTEIDLKNKPANFSEISPYGKVPVLLHGDERIYESAIINEYLDEAFPEPKLMPATPAARAAARIWMDYCSQQFVKASWNYFKAEADDERAAAGKELADCMLFMEHEGLRKLSDGPYWLGGDISLVDIQFMPFFQRYTGEGRSAVPAECERLLLWLNTMTDRASWLETAAAKAA